MKNGSLANNSEMKLPTHTGTHVDAPGHVFDHYFDAGFDVDTLDLDVLNGSCILFYSIHCFVFLALCSMLNHVLVLLIVFDHFLIYLFYFKISLLSLTFIMNQLQWGPFQQIVLEKKVNKKFGVF